MLLVEIPQYCTSEIEYTLDLILSNFFEIHWSLGYQSTESGIVISSNTDPKRLSIPTVFFDQGNQSWLTIESMPKLPLTYWTPTSQGLNPKLTKDEIPILFGDPGILITSDECQLNLDVIGSVFFLLSRYEEVVVGKEKKDDKKKKQKKKKKNKMGFGA